VTVHEPSLVPVAGVLLAAGAGRRFGGPKALVGFRGEPLVDRGARLLRAAGCDPVLVVLGARAGIVRQGASLAGARVVVNPRWECGMGSSLAAGLDAVPAVAGAAVVALVDQPLVTPEAVRRLVAAWRAGAVAAVATYGGRPRNPVLLDRSVWGQARRRAVGDVGARAFLRARPDLVTAVDCDGAGSPDDVDTVADLRALTVTGTAGK
jgi:CTP:molybdopterin cytidylyltransferase MocA